LNYLVNAVLEELELKLHMHLDPDNSQKAKAIVSKFLGERLNVIGLEYVWDIEIEKQANDNFFDRADETCCKQLATRLFKECSKEAINEPFKRGIRYSLVFLKGSQ